QERQRRMGCRESRRWNRRLSGMDGSTRGADQGRRYPLPGLALHLRLGGWPARWRDCSSLSGAWRPARRLDHRQRDRHRAARARWRDQRGQLLRGPTERVPGYPSLSVVVPHYRLAPRTAVRDLPPVLRGVAATAVLAYACTLPPRCRRMDGDSYPLRSPRARLGLRSDGPGL